MTNTQNTTRKENLIEEFERLAVEPINDFKQDYITSTYLIGTLANWWLSKLDSELDQARREERERMLSIVNKRRASTDEGSKELDNLYLALSQEQ